MSESEADAFWQDRFDESGESVAVAEPEEPAPTNELVNLIQLGKLTKTIRLGGNEFVLRTLTSGEELEIGLITKPYIGTSEEDRAYAIAVVAAALETVNGKLLVTPLGPEDRSLLERKFVYLRETYYWPILRDVYNGYLELMREQIAAFEELASK